MTSAEAGCAGDEDIRPPPRRSGVAFPAAEIKLEFLDLERMKTAKAARPHTPKIAFVAQPTGYTASSGKAIRSDYMDLCARIFSMGKLHHAMTGIVSPSAPG